MKSTSRLYTYIMFNLWDFLSRSFPSSWGEYSVKLFQCPSSATTCKSGWIEGLSLEIVDIEGNFKYFLWILNGNFNHYLKIRDVEPHSFKTEAEEVFKTNRFLAAMSTTPELTRRSALPLAGTIDKLVEFGRLAPISPYHVINEF
jgi:hypothetical protein